MMVRRVERSTHCLAKWIVYLFCFFAGANFSTTECIACRARQQTFIYIATSFVRYTNRVTTNKMRRLWNKKKSIFKPGNLSYSLASLAQLNSIGIFSYIYTHILYIYFERLRHSLPKPQCTSLFRMYHCLALVF